MNNYKEYKGKMAFHPGFYLEEIMKEEKLDIKEFASKLKISPDKLSKILNGKSDIDEEIANELSNNYQISKDCWFNLQKTYKEDIKGML
ncbi:MAG: HigA family addiction module antitoxin [Erysipelotrichaceae bacterium]|nr:HigA family addiction module antitoxin [Erysipelotrichaceae bacterium]